MKMNILAFWLRHGVLRNVAEKLGRRKGTKNRTVASACADVGIRKPGAGGGTSTGDDPTPKGIDFQCQMASLSWKKALVGVAIGKCDGGGLTQT